ncbi:hypothetical protein B0O99DRAFT_162550 [Bisporella sp. PMI_857]|nr:hypothetical protein B0O99DRAFT_162550 [Bisporella sp. PMI_857]
MHHLTDPLFHDISHLKPSLPPPTQTLPHPQTLFTLFSELPTELRLKIWEHALPPRRILTITYSTVRSIYLSRTPPPTTLSITCESRSLTLHHYAPLILGPPPRKPALSPLIPFCPSTDTLYITSLAPILSQHLPELLYNLSTSPSRHAIQHLALDLRIWNICCDAGLLGILGRMRGLEGVDIVVEFGREFKGETAFIAAPEWRGDLDWVARRAEEGIGEERRKMLKAGVRNEGDGELLRGKEIRVRCVLLTKGGEQA